MSSRLLINSADFDSLLGTTMTDTALIKTTFGSRFSLRDSNTNPLTVTNANIKCLDSHFRLQNQKVRNRYQTCLILLEPLEVEIQGLKTLEIILTPLINTVQNKFAENDLPEICWLLWQNGTFSKR